MTSIGKSKASENNEFNRFVESNNNSSATKEDYLLAENPLDHKLLKSEDYAAQVFKMNRCIPKDHCMTEKSCEMDSIMMCRCSRKDLPSYGMQPRLKEINGSTSRSCLFNPKEESIFFNSTFINSDYTLPSSVVTKQTYESILMTSWLVPTILGSVLLLFLMTILAVWLRSISKKRQILYRLGQELPSSRSNNNPEILRNTPQHMMINVEYSPFIDGSVDYTNNNVAVAADAAVVYEMPVIVNSASDSDEQPSNYQDAYHSFRHLVVSHERVEFMTQIGEGAFGTVHKASLWDVEFKSKRLVAVKTVKDGASDLLKETELMMSFHHPNILAVIGLVVQDVDVSISSPSIIMEYMKYGDLATVLRSNKPGLGIPVITAVTQRDLLNIVLQVCRGMTYLASKRFVHRDLACRNCLVGENLLIKVSDFGMSRDVYSTEYYMIRGKNRILPIRWMAPESLDFGHFSEQSDVWSFGVVFWEIFTYGSTPYNIFCNKEVSEKVIHNEIRLERPENCSEDLWEQVLLPCWQTRENRPRFSELMTLLEHFHSLDVSKITYAVIQHV